MRHRHDLVEAGPDLRAAAAPAGTAAQAPGRTGPRADHPGRRSHRAAAAVLRPAAAVVPQPAPPRRRGLQQRARPSPDRAAGRGEVDRRGRPVGRPARGTAHDLPGRGRQARPGRAPGWGLPGRHCARFARGPGPRAHHRVRDPVRPAHRATVAGAARPGRRHRERSSAHGTPHSHRRLVDGCAHHGAEHALQRRRTARPRCPVRGLRGVAT